MQSLSACLGTFRIGCKAEPIVSDANYGEHNPILETVEVRVCVQAV